MKTSEFREAQYRHEDDGGGAVIEWSARLLAAAMVAGLLWAIAAMVVGVIGAVRAVWGAL